jgi:hypothetical protein
LEIWREGEGSIGDFFLFGKRPFPFPFAFVSFFLVFGDDFHYRIGVVIRGLVREELGAGKMRNWRIKIIQAIKS